MPGQSKELPPLPIDLQRWNAMMTQLELPPRQVRIAELVARGLRDKQIASELGIGEPTVRTHMGRLFRRVNVGDRIELIIRLFALASSEGALDASHRS